MARTLINVPPKAKRGQVIEIKTLISHVMETGYRRNEVGAMVPRDIINTFVCTYNGEEVFRTGLHPAHSTVISADAVSTLPASSVHLNSNFPLSAATAKKLK